MENYVGKRLDGRYEIHEIIGVGGMSVVYKAYDNVDDRIVAVKILKEEFIHDEEFVRRFKNESKAIAVLSHPNIVKVYDVSFGNKLQYIVMEYVDGITLKEYIQKQGLIAWNDAVFIVAQILRALQHAHDKGIVHRDIKPQNIILLPSGNIKVTDFGIARFSRTETKTLTENAIGSVHYISPEQAKGEFTDERADIYSLGVVFYELLAGRVPFESDSAVSVALMQINDEPRRITELNPDIPIGLEQICIHAMQKNPLDRYQTATEMLLDLEDVIKNHNATFDYSYYVDKQPTKYIKREDTVSRQSVNDDSRYDRRRYDDEADAKKNKKKVFLATVIGLVLLVGAVIGLIVFLTDGVDANYSKIDNFVGEIYDTVVSNYSNYKFVPQYMQTSEYEPGTIIKQDPEAGSRVASGAQITLTVASSAESIPMPNCYNITKEMAIEALERYELNNIRISEISSETVEAGYVVYTEPQAETQISNGTLITLYVSTGVSTTNVNTFSVPNVTGLSKNDAQSFLKRYGFKNVVVVTRDSTVPKDTVLSQDPKYGSNQREDAKITIYVSTGYTTTTKPPEYNINVKVKLPICIDENGNFIKDNLISTVNGVQYSKQQVTLNGSVIDLAIVQERGENVTVAVLLDEVAAQQNFVFNLTENKTASVDFSNESFSNETTHPASNNPSSTDSPSANNNYVQF